MNVLALRPGCGGPLLGIRLAIGSAFNPICIIEERAYAVATLIKNMESGNLHEVPIWDQIETFNSISWSKQVDFIIGSFIDRGLEDTALLESVERIFKEVQPERALFEMRSEVLKQREPFIRICSIFQSMGFKVEVEEISARDIGFTHGRKRIFMALTRDNEGKPMANTKSQGLEGFIGYGENNEKDEGREGSRQPTDSQQDLERIEKFLLRFPHPPPPRDFESWSEILESSPHFSAAIPEQASSQFRGVADGFSNRLERLWILGGDSVPLMWTLAYHTFFE
jgi:site-specific DNA-cytosine methylase|tara:strand:- start:1821 stop:2666 length:846 start_codon:yes stop_codon:yes gene_type:complete